MMQYKFYSPVVAVIDYTGNDRLEYAAYFDYDPAEICGEDGEENFDYLSGEDIPQVGRLMALADVYDALISKRVYKPAFDHETARRIIVEGGGTQFDPLVVEAFLQEEENFQSLMTTYPDEDIPVLPTE